MAINLFGFTIGREEKPELTNQSIVTPVSDDGASTVSTAGFYGTFVGVKLMRGLSTMIEPSLVSVVVLAL